MKMRIINMLVLVLVFVLACIFVTLAELGIIYVILKILGVSSSNIDLFLILYLLMLFLVGEPGFFKLLTSFGKFLKACETTERMVTDEKN